LDGLHSPAIVSARRPVPCSRVPGLLAVGRVSPFVVTRYRDQAAVAFERFAEERLFGDCLGPRVERRQLQFFERFRPPGRNEAPSHGHGRPRAALVAAGRTAGGGTGAPTQSCGDDVLIPPQTASQFGKSFRKRQASVTMRFTAFPSLVGAVVNPATSRHSPRSAARLCFRASAGCTPGAAFSRDCAQ
jgi:hypothetical protein